MKSSVKDGLAIAGLAALFLGAVVGAVAVDNHLDTVTPGRAQARRREYERSAKLARAEQLRTTARAYDERADALVGLFTPWTTVRSYREQAELCRLAAAKLAYG